MDSWLGKDFALPLNYVEADIYCILALNKSDVLKDGSAPAAMVSVDTASMKELDLLSNEIEDLKR